jgi:fucose 4-O-acetylase-like acetyltransferase
MKRPKSVLWDVCYIRLFLIVLLIAFHAFCPYSSPTWMPFEGQTPNAGYHFFDILLYSVLIETFVFISGYIVGYKCRREEEAQSAPGRLQALGFRALIVKRAQRLLIPSFIFSALFLFAFGDYATYSVARNLYNILAGYGHLWFLPMLFWCFVLLYLLERIPLSPLVKFLLLLLFVSRFSGHFPEYFQFSRAVNYMVYFYAGYCIHRYHVSIGRWARPRYIVGTFLLFVLVFLFDYAVRYGFVAEHIARRIPTTVLNTSRYVYPLIGVISLYLCTLQCVQNKNIGGGYSFVLQLSGYCFGVYICQEFILRVLYYHTPLPLVVPADAVPWLGFALTLLCSLLITHFALKSRVGRFLLG